MMSNDNKVQNMLENWSFPVNSSNFSFLANMRSRMQDSILIKPSQQVLNLNFLGERHDPIVVQIDK